MQGKELEAIRFIRTDIGDLLKNCINNAEQFPELCSCQMRLDSSATVQAMIIPEVIHTMLLNLLVNAGEASPGGGIQVTLCDAAEGFCIEVHDSGAGVPKEIREKIFQPHFSTKPDRPGLGLLGVKSAVTIHRGRIEVDDSPLGGACFRVTLPYAPITRNEPG